MHHEDIMLADMSQTEASTVGFHLPESWSPQMQGAGWWAPGPGGGGGGWGRGAVCNRDRGKDNRKRRKPGGARRGWLPHSVRVLSASELHT